MADWALFWFLMFSSAALVLSWALYLTERERRRERAARLRWKRDYIELRAAAVLTVDVPEPRASGEVT